MVAVCLVMLFGATALAVDAGRLWEQRRHLVTTTDAAALAAAQLYGEASNGCAAAPGWIANNHATAAMTSCNLVPIGSNAGHVTVQARTDVDFSFAPALPSAPSSASVPSSSTAIFGQANTVFGLRPIGICKDHPALQAWITAGAQDDGQIHRIGYNKNDNAHCGEATGNWGLMAFTGEQSNAVFKEHVEVGYDGGVSIGDEVRASTGSFNNSIQPQLNTLKGQTFAVPIFSSVIDPNGQNARYVISGFLTITLHDFKVTGAAAGRWMDVEFHRRALTGTCCSSGPSTGAIVIAICAVDPDATAIAACNP
jgi:hypothetical protein